MEKKLSAGLAVAAAAICSGVKTYALSISSNAKPSDFDSYTISDFQGVVLGTVFFILRLFGILALIWGLYNAVIAKKSGDARQYGMAFTKLTLGFCMVCLPTILRAANIIN